MSTKNVTIHDVADLAGVSIGTVSAVVNRKDTVSKSTFRRVLQAIDELNYRPSAAARRRLQPSVEKSIGLVIKEIRNPYFADIMIGAQEAAVEHGYSVLVASSEESYELEQKVVALLEAKDIEGLIINPLLDEDADLAHLFELKQHNIPLVFLESVRGLKSSIVEVDNVAASKATVQYLIDLGHQRIAHFAGPRYSMHSDERIEGMRRAFSAQRLTFAATNVVRAGAHLKDGYRAGLEFFRDRSEEERPTAVTCYNDQVAIGLMRALRELGLHVPRDISVIGYDDIDMASYTAVPLTTVRVPKEEMGRRAAEILIQQTEAPDAGKREKVSLEAELVVRESTRSLNDNYEEDAQPEWKVVKLMSAEEPDWEASNAHPSRSDRIGEGSTDA